VAEHLCIAEMSTPQSLVDSLMLVFDPGRYNYFMIVRWLLGARKQRYSGDKKICILMKKFYEKT
jgi:hypothetical protein